MTSEDPRTPEATPAPEKTDVRLADHTTLRVGGPARRFVTAHSEDDLIALVRGLDASGEPVLVLGGGSNLLVGPDGFEGTVVKVETRGVHADVSSCSGSVVTVAAGESWDELVATSVAQEWSGLETLAGIPGQVGATPIQNVGAYGSDVSQTIETVSTLDRATGQRATLPVGDCGFGYRTSRFKAEPGRHLVLSVTFQLRLASLSAPIRYAELAKRLGVEVGQRVETSRVRDAVLALRAQKGMVLDASDHDTWSAGSFFTNPILDADQANRLPADAPRYLADEGTKTSAAWLIEHAGFGRGFGDGAARLSTKHTLALTNRGQADADDVLQLARQVRDGVRSTFGISLVPEPVLVSCSL